MHVLLVEDDETVSAGLEALLEMEGMVVDCVSTAAEAIASIERGIPDIIILDVRLPDMSGVELYEIIDARWPELPVVFSSGHAHLEDLEIPLSSPHVGFLRKPYEIERLVQELHERTSHGRVP